MTEQNTTQQKEIKEENVELKWLDDEEKVLDEMTPPSDYERLDGLVLEEGKITEFDIIVDKEPFRRWKDEENNVVKVIIPVKKDDKKFSFWLNIKNPTYKEIIRKLKEGKRHFKILRTGKMKQTRYQLVE